MCCFFVVLMFFGPRLAFLVYWLVAPLRINLAFGNFNFPWLVGLAGLLFLPWTTLMFVIIYTPGGLHGWDWLWIGLAIGADISSYLGTYHKRQQVPGYTATPLP